MHQPFIHVAGAAAALPGANIDTDVIMPKQFLKGIDRSGLRDGTLHDLRFDGQGGLRQDFMLNLPEWRDARFLVVGPNFGCGSSASMPFGVCCSSVSAPFSAPASPASSRITPPTMVCFWSASTIRHRSVDVAGQ